jgi:hypothetical protein
MATYAQLSSAPAPSAPPPQPKPYDMSAFESKLSEFQTVLVDLNGDGVPDVEVPAAQAAKMPGNVVGAGQQQRPQQMADARPPQMPSPGPQGAPQGNVDTAPLIAEAKDRLARGEPREAIIQDLFQRVTQKGQQPDPMSDFAPRPPMPSSMRRPRFNSAEQVEGGVTTTQPPSQVPLAPLRDEPEASPLDSYEQGFQQFRDARQMANDDMGARSATLEAPPEPQQGPSGDGGWPGLIPLAKDALGSAKNTVEGAYDSLPSPRMPTWDDASSAMQGAGDMAMAAQATGGPPGAILGGIGNAIKNAPAVGNALRNRLIEGTRSLSSEGRAVNDARNRLTDSFRASEELARQTGQPQIYSPRQFRDDVISPSMPGLPSNIEANYANSVSGRVGSAAANHLTKDYPPALPPPTPGQPNRLIAPEAQPVPPPRAYEMAGGARVADQGAQYARDLNRGTNASPRQGANEEAMDEFVQWITTLPRTEASELPRALKSFSNQTGTPLRDVVEGLARRGYKLDADSVPQHAFQDRQAGGRWGSVSPEWRELLSIIRERSGRR